MKKLLMLLSAVALVGMTSETFARDQIRIVGSSTVFPFSTSVAESFGKTTKYKTPVVESTGSGGGLKLFCSGVGAKHPDITNASRKIKSSEIELCKKNGVTDITEVMVGFDGIVIANSKKGKQLKLSLKDIYLALAKQIPINGVLNHNPHKTWKDVNPKLPNIKIEVLGPPPTSGTRDAFVELAMEGGAKQIPMLKALRKENKKAFKMLAHTIREDGAFIEAGENDNLIIQKLDKNINAYGIFGFSFLDSNTDKIQGSLVNEWKPTFDNIADGKYPISRSLYFYVKNQHIGTVSGIQEYVDIFLSERVSGEEGFLTDKGLIPVLGEERKNMKNKL